MDRRGASSEAPAASREGQVGGSQGGPPKPDGDPEGCPSAVRTDTNTRASKAGAAAHPAETNQQPPKHPKFPSGERRPEMKSWEGHSRKPIQDAGKDCETPPSERTHQETSRLRGCRVVCKCVAPPSERNHPLTRPPRGCRADFLICIQRTSEPSLEDPDPEAVADKGHPRRPHGSPE